MRALLSFDEKRYRAVPLGILGTFLVFMFVMLMEMVLGSITYGIALLFKPNEYLMSVVVNVGTWIGKFLILLALWELSHTEKRGEDRVFKNEIGVGKGRTLVLYIFALIVCFRVFYDPAIGEWVLATFGIDDALVESMDFILNAPLFGLAYVLIIGPIFEEILYRGFIFSGMLRKGYRFWPAALISTFYFAFMHLNVAQSINAFGIGLVAAYVYYETGNLKYSIGLHIMNNTFVTLISGVTESWIVAAPLFARLAVSLLGFVLMIMVAKRFSKKCEELSEESSEMDLDLE